MDELIDSLLEPKTYKQIEQNPAADSNMADNDDKKDDQIDSSSLVSSVPAFVTTTDN